MDTTPWDFEPVPECVATLAKALAGAASALAETPVEDAYQRALSLAMMTKQLVAWLEPGDSLFTDRRRGSADRRISAGYGA